MPKPREHKKGYGKDIAQRPEIAALRIEEGHWEGDTVVGKKAGKEAVVLSLLEKKTENYIALHISGKDADSVLSAMQLLKEEFGDKFSQVFKTITVDNGPEFSGFAQVENWGSQVYFAHPYTSWERPQNERHNGLFRALVIALPCRCCVGTSFYHAAIITMDFFVSCPTSLCNQPSTFF